jgi:hypothetical protein
MTPLKKILTPIKKWAKDLYRHFSQEDTQTVNKHMLNISSDVKMQTKTTISQVWRYTCNPSTLEAEAKGGQVRGQFTGLHSEFDISLGYTASLCLKKSQPKNNKIYNHTKKIPFHTHSTASIKK